MTINPSTTWEVTWKISDIGGGNVRRVTLAEFRAELNARKKMAAPIVEAVRRGDLEACSAAQAAMRARFA